ncbi:MAG: asparagine synthetase B family protein [Acidobacteriota bacterium]
MVHLEGGLAQRSSLLRRLGQAETCTTGNLLCLLYEQSELDLPRQLAGTAAFILIDPRRRRLLAVRDRLGQRGLFFRRSAEGIRLAPRVADLLTGSEGVADLSQRALVAQVCGDAPPPRETFYRGIEAVEAGCFLLAEGDRVEQVRYWRPELAAMLRLSSDEAYGEALLAVLDEVMADYRSEDSAAVALSSGFDSTAVAASLASAGDEEGSPSTAAESPSLTALLWAAPELPEADESPLAGEVADRLGLDRLTLRADHLWPLSTPLAERVRRDSPLCGFYEDLWQETCRRLRQAEISVLYTGVGGDHLFGGDVFDYLDRLATGRWVSLARDLRRHRRWSPGGTLRLLRKFLWAPLRTWWRPTRWAPEVPWLASAHRPRVPSIEGRRRILASPGRVQRLWTLRDPLIPSLVLEMGQRAAAHGIDLRHPLLDHRLFELAAALPPSQTFSAGERKVILRRAFAGRLPAAVLESRDKIYPTPILRRGLVERGQAQARELMRQPRVVDLGLVDGVALRQAYDDFCAGRSRSSLFWHTWTLEAWLRKYF